MGRKKRKLNLELKPFCYYCDREFDDEKVLLQHQKAKHFKCLVCDRKLDLANSLSIHMMQVHKQNLKAVPNSLPKRSNPKLSIRGMSGVPTELIEDNLNKLKQKINALNLRRQQKANNSIKNPKNVTKNTHYFPTPCGANYYNSPYNFMYQPNNMMYPSVPFLGTPWPNAPNDMIPHVNNGNKEPATYCTPPPEDVSTSNEGAASKNNNHIDNEQNEAKNDTEENSSKVKQTESYMHSSKSMSNEEMSKSEEKITLNLIDPLNIFENLSVNIPMFPSNAKTNLTNKKGNASINLSSNNIPQILEDISNTKTNTNTNTNTNTTINTTINTTPVNTVTGNTTTSAMSSVPPPPPFPPTSNATSNAHLSPHHSSSALRYVPFIPPPPTSMITPSTTSQIPGPPFMLTSHSLPTPPPPPSTLSSSVLPTISSTPPLLPTTTTGSTTPIYFTNQITPAKCTSIPPISEIVSKHSATNINNFQKPMPQEAQEVNTSTQENEFRNGKTDFLYENLTKEVLYNYKNVDGETHYICSYNNSKAISIKLNLPPQTDMSTPYTEGVILFYKEMDNINQVKAIQEF